MKERLTPDEGSLHQSQIFYMKRIEKENFDRVVRLKKIRKSNIFTGLGLAGSVLGIYLYSIFAVKQENFLDELDEKRA